MTIAEMRDFINRQEWIFAKTYAEKAPHEYMLKDRLVGSEDEMLEFARTIFEKGMVMSFWYHENRYIYLDGHLYWSMDSSPETTVLINRSNVKDYDIVIMKKQNP